MRSERCSPADCVVFRYPDGRREFDFGERLPIEGARIVRNGSTYVVLDVQSEEIGAVVTLGAPESSPILAT